MSLFRRRSLRSTALIRPEIEVEPETTPTYKKKRSFFLHARSESAVSPMGTFDSATSPLPQTPYTPFTPFKENGFLSSLQRSSSTRKLQKRPLSGSSVNASSATSSPNYLLDKPPRISSKDYTHAYQNLYILGDGQDDEMFTLFEMINGTRPIVYDNNSGTPILSSSPAVTPELEVPRKPAISEKNHSRTSSASSYSAMSNSTYQTDFSDFQFDFAPIPPEKVAIPRPNAQDIFQRKLAANMSIINEQPNVESEYEDFVGSLGELTSDDDSDSDYDDDDDFVIEEGQAVQVSLKRLPSPTVITIRSSCEF